MRRIGVGSIYAYSRAKPMPESAVLAATKPPLPAARHGASADMAARRAELQKARRCGYLSRQ
ncbi:MAG: hypothetical protein ACR65T_08705 [Methylocystis sp.]|uniref:hypothetical protein n=1 Tax=Methylocystis sp. TaxID=1911079 RepID=UPI003DA5D446